MSDHKRTATFAKKIFDKKFEQIEGRAPLNERMAKKQKQEGLCCKISTLRF